MTIEQKNALVKKIEQFFNAYISGSYEAFKQFRECSAFSVDTRSFDESPDFTTWLAEGKHPFNTPDQKLKTIWIFTEYLNARSVWMRKKIEKDIQNGVAISEDRHSKWARQSLSEFHQGVTAGTIAGTRSYKILAISPRDFYIYVFASTNADFPIIGFQNHILRGMQSEGYDVIHYDESPKSIIASDGNCLYAVLTASVLVTTWNCYVPIVVEFYWSPADGGWLPWKMGRFTMGIYNVLF